MGDIQRSGTEALAATLSRAREDAGLTRRELADRTGLSYPYISQLETGYRGPSAEAMQRLTEVLGVPVDAMVAAMAERDTPSPRMSKPAPARKTQSRWIANPAWAPVQPVAARGAAPGRMRSPAAAPRLDERETLVTHALQAESGAPSPPATESVVAEIVARLGQLPPQERMAALAEIQNTVVRTVVADAAGASGAPSGA